MFWYVLIGFFAGVGVLFLAWLLFGCLLPVGGKCTLAVFCQPGKELAMVRRYRWLRDLGLLRGKLILLDSTLPPGIQAEIAQHYPGVTFSTAQLWLQERK